MKKQRQAVFRGIQGKGGLGSDHGARTVNEMGQIAKAFDAGYAKGKNER